MVVDGPCLQTTWDRGSLKLTLTKYFFSLLIVKIFVLFVWFVVIHPQKSAEVMLLWPVILTTLVCSYASPTETVYQYLAYIISS